MRAASFEPGVVVSVATAGPAAPSPANLARCREAARLLRLSLTGRSTT